MIKKNNSASLTKEEKEAAKLEKKRLAEDKHVTADGVEVDTVPTEDEEMTIAEARRIIAENKAKRLESNVIGKAARVFNGKTTYAVFSEAQYGPVYKDIAKAWAHDRQFDVEYI
tara:strand:- start:1618 stop:1959 length:342 start_codon:yes stop_codon:yes gene_type:complete